MALKNVAKMLSRWFSSGTIRDDKLRNLCVRLEQAAEKAKQLNDECDAIFAVKRAFPMDRLIWLGFIINLAHEIGEQVLTISTTKEDIKFKESQLSARRLEKHKLQLSA
ncbi:hypothetical protein C5167_002294 [Papaver somniferum]|uniref:Uncharacterized protein n=1 Tax=Papaver somniferum TaxID=3469 RepID=A0A4Y7KXS0_PAPSO|nr:uncharacterized protein LOC113310069 [Papaver somniferum]RZC78094.1 hypothetical protein C5167_002294 [Papaver somniferum]